MRRRENRGGGERGSQVTANNVLISSGEGMAEDDPLLIYNSTAFLLRYVLVYWDWASLRRYYGMVRRYYGMAESLHSFHAQTFRCFFSVFFFSVAKEDLGNVV